MESHTFSISFAGVDHVISLEITDLPLLRQSECLELTEANGYSPSQYEQYFFHLSKLLLSCRNVLLFKSYPMFYCTLLQCEGNRVFFGKFWSRRCVLFVKRTFYGVYMEKKYAFCSIFTDFLDHWLFDVYSFYKRE